MNELCNCDKCSSEFPHMISNEELLTVVEEHKEAKRCSLGGQLYVAALVVLHFRKVEGY